MRNAVDIPEYAHGINQAHAYRNPPRRIGKHEEKCEHVDEMKQSTKNANRIPFGIGEKFHSSFCCFRTEIDPSKKNLKSKVFAEAFLSARVLIFAAGGASRIMVRSLGPKWTGGTK